MSEIKIENANTKIKVLIIRKPKIEKITKVTIPYGNQNKMILTFPSSVLKIIESSIPGWFLANPKIKIGSLISQGETIGKIKIHGFEVEFGEEIVVEGLEEEIVAKEDLLLCELCQEERLEYGKIIYSYLPLSPPLKDFIKNLLKSE